MSVTLGRLVTGAVATLATVVVTTVSGTTAASADPVTVTGSSPNKWDSSITVSDTTPEVGDVITLDYRVVGNFEGGGVLATDEQVKSTDGTTPFGSFLVDRVCVSTPSTPRVWTGDCDVEGSSPPSEFNYRVLFEPFLAQGRVATWALKFTVAPEAAGQSFTLDLGADTAPPVTFTVTSGEADIGVDLQAQSGLLTSSIPYTLHIANNGPGTASSATVTTQLPVSTQAVSQRPARRLRLQRRDRPGDLHRQLPGQRSVDDPKLQSATKSAHHRAAAQRHSHPDRQHTTRPQPGQRQLHRQLPRTHPTTGSLLTPTPRQPRRRPMTREVMGRQNLQPTRAVHREAGFGQYATAVRIHPGVGWVGACVVPGSTPSATDRERRGRPRTRPPPPTRTVGERHRHVPTLDRFRALDVVDDRDREFAGVGRRCREHVPITRDLALVAAVTAAGNVA